MQVSGPLPLGEGRGLDPRDSGELRQILVVETLYFAVGDDVGGPEIQEVLPRDITVADQPGVGTLVEGMFMVNDMSPGAVALDERYRVAVTHDVSRGTPGAHRLRSHDLLTGDGHELGLGEHQRQTLFLARACAHGKGHIRTVEILDRLEFLGIVIVYDGVAALQP